MNMSETSFFSDPDFQFLSSYSSFLNQFSGKIAALLSILNTFPIGNRPFEMKKILDKLDELTEQLLLTAKGANLPAQTAPAKKEQISMDALMERMYKRNGWRQAQSDEVSNRARQLDSYAEYQAFSRKHIHGRKVNHKTETAFATLQSVFERDYQHFLIQHFVTAEEAQAAIDFQQAKRVLDADAPRNFELEIRIFLHQIYGVIPNEPITSLFPSQFQNQPSTRKTCFEFAKGLAEVFQAHNINIIRAAFYQMSENTPVFLRENFMRILVDLEATFSTYTANTEEALFAIIDLAEPADGSSSLRYSPINAKILHGKISALRCFVDAATVGGEISSHPAY